MDEGGEVGESREVEEEEEEEEEEEQEQEQEPDNNVMTAVWYRLFK